MSNKEELIKRIEKLKAEKEHHEALAKIQDVFQHSFKIYLNSVYGFTGTQFSPVFSQDIAEAVTLTGQATTKEMVRYTNAALNKLGGTDNSVSHVVAGDTDLIVKPNDNWELESNKALTTEGTVYEWTFQAPIDLNNVLFMVAPGMVDVHGQFQIISFEVTLA